MRFQEVDHPPLRMAGAWAQTRERWHSEGLPRDTDLNEYFEIEPMPVVNAGGATGFFPAFEQEVFHENEEEIIYQDPHGPIARRYKKIMSMPEWLDFPVKGPDDLRRVMDERFDPDRIDERFPEDWEEKCEELNRPGRQEVALLDGGCYYGPLRNLAGVEMASLLFYDAPELVEELFERIEYITLENMRRTLKKVKEVDYLGFGADIAFKTSTLISPGTLKKFIAPRYRKAVELARAHGIDIDWYDSDGNLNAFMPIYFEVGIHGFGPCEVAADMDPADLRERYGLDISMMGGIDKRAVAAGPEAIRKEVDRKVPRITDQGGYIPYIDHSVPTDVSWDDFRYYRRYLRERLGA